MEIEAWRSEQLRLRERLAGEEELCSSLRQHLKLEETLRHAAHEETRLSSTLFLSFSIIFSLFLSLCFYIVIIDLLRSLPHFLLSYWMC